MKIDKGELEKFRLTLPEGIQREQFHWLITRYCVATALFIIKQAELTPNNIIVKDWATALGMAGPQQEEGSFSFNLFTGVTDTEALRDMVNPDIPLIIVEHTFKAKRKTEMSTLVIDGNKRLRKAFLQGRENVKAYYLPKHLAKLCIL